MKSRVTLSGYYGYGNAGDEAVLAGLVQGFRAARPASELTLTALSGHPAETRAAHGIAAAHRYRPGPLLRAVSRTDLFLSGGGSLLQDVTSAHGIFYYLAVVRMAQMLGKKTMFIAQGIGPLTLPRSRRLTAAVVNRLDAVTVRDAESARLLREIGVTRPPVEVTADPALLLGETAACAEGAAGTFGVALRPWHGQTGLAAQVADACRPALSGRQVRLFPMQPGSDTGPAEQFAAQWHQGITDQGTKGTNTAAVCPTQNGLPALMEAIGACEMMIGMRLHALILAAACGVPAVALSYDPKVTAFMESSGQGDAVYDLSHPDPKALVSLIARVHAERAPRRTALCAALPSLRALAMRNVEAALSLLS